MQISPPKSTQSTAFSGTFQRLVLKFFSKLAKNLPEVLCLTIITAFYGYFTSYGTWDFIEPDPEGQARAYDVMAESLLQGKTNITRESLPTEIFVTASGLQMYFGPWPSLLRIPLNALFPSLEGQWGRASLFAACLLSLWAVFRLTGQALSNNPSLNPSGRRFWRLLSTTTLCLGSPVLFLSSSPNIYHEAIGWGLAGFLWTLVGAGTWLGGVAAGVTLLSRVPFGITAIAFQALLGLFQKTPKKRIAALAPIAIACLFQSWINTERFGSPWTFADWKLYEPLGWKEIQTFNPARVTTTLSSYFLPHAGNFSWKFPYVCLAAAPLPSRELTDWMEPTLSLLLTSPTLLLLSALGAGTLLLNLRALTKKKGKLALTPTHLALTAGIAGALLQTALILSFPTIMQRYVLEFLPLACFLSLTALSQVGSLKAPSLKILATSLLTLSLTINTLSSYSWLGFTYHLQVHKDQLQWNSLLFSKNPRNLEKIVALWGQGPTKNTNHYLLCAWRWPYAPPFRSAEIEETLKRITPKLHSPPQKKDAPQTLP